MQQIAGSEGPRATGAQAGVDAHPAGPGIEQCAGGHCQLVVGDPVGGEDDDFTADLAPGAKIGDDDRFHALGSMISLSAARMRSAAW